MAVTMGIVIFALILNAPCVAASPGPTHEPPSLQERARAYCRADYSPGTVEFKRCVSSYVKQGGVQFSEKTPVPWYKRPFLVILAGILVAIYLFGWFHGWHRDERFGADDFFDD